MKRILISQTKRLSKIPYLITRILIKTKIRKLKSSRLHQKRLQWMKMQRMGLQRMKLLKMKFPKTVHRVNSSFKRTAPRNSPTKE